MRVLACSQVASSADTIQTGLAGVLHPILQRLLPDSPKKGQLSLGINLLITIGLNVRATSRRPTRRHQPQAHAPPRSSRAAPRPAAALPSPR